MFFVIKEVACESCDEHPGGKVYEILGCAKSKPLAKKLIPKPKVGESYHISKAVATLDAVQDVALVEREAEPEKADE